MQLTNIFSLALLAASQVATAPVAEPEAQTPNAANELVKRALPAAATCDTRVYSFEDVDKAWIALTHYGNLPAANKPRAGTRSYPQQFGDNNGNLRSGDAALTAALDAIPECKTGQAGKKYFEYPLANPAWTGGPAQSQGPDRVIAIAPNVGQGQQRVYTYCLAAYHPSWADGSFRPCT